MATNSLLTDITLDVRQLTCVMKALEAEGGEALREVALRTVTEMQSRLDELKARLAADGGVATSPPGQAAEEGTATPAEDTTPSTAVNEPGPALEVREILADRIRPARDLRHAISLADRFRFTRELFGGDAERMSDAVAQLSTAASFAEALTILSCLTPANEESAAYVDLTELLRKYFI